jgi:hypothetical protein
LNLIFNLIASRLFTGDDRFQYGLPINQLFVSKERLKKVEAAGSIDPPELFL